MKSMQSEERPVKSSGNKFSAYEAKKFYQNIGILQESLS